MFIRVLIILLIPSFSFAQEIPKCKLSNKTTSTESIIWMGVATLGYTGIDYLGYNTLGKKNEDVYRALQKVAFVGINLLLDKYVSRKSAVGFSILVFSGLPDAGYYMIDKTSGGFNGFSYGNEFNLQKELNHLNFMLTTIGSKHIRGVDLITNVILGTAIAITIQL